MAWIFTTFVTIALVFFVLILKSSSRGIFAPASEKGLKGEKKKKPCPVCGSLLDPGEKVTSHEYRGKDSSIVHIFGCPRCLGDGSVLIRSCPVCKKEMGKEDYLAGTMVRGNDKIHLKVKGCSNCIG